jgi:hypothetical protein
VIAQKNWNVRPTPRERGRSETCATSLRHLGKAANKNKGGLLAANKVNG